MLRVSGIASSEVCGGHGTSGTVPETAAPSGPGLFARLARSHLTPASASRVYNLPAASGQRPAASGQRPAASGMMCARRLAGAHNPAPSTAAASARPDPRPGRPRACLSPLLPALALLLGALGLGLFAAAPAHAQTAWEATHTPADQGSGSFGCTPTSQCNSRLTDNAFTVGGQAYTFSSILQESNGQTFSVGFTAAINTVLSGRNFCVGSTVLAFSAATLHNSDHIAQWTSLSLSTWSAGAKIPLSIGSTCPPGAPTGLSATAGNTRLDLSWTAPTATGGSTITGYDVHYTSSTTVDDDADPSGSNPANAWVAVSRSGTGTTQALTGLTNGTTYKVRVRARNSGAARFWARTTAAPAAPTHAAPTGLTVTPGNRELGLSWTAPATGTVTGYDVHYTANTSVGNDEPPTSLGSQQGWWDTDFTGTSTTDTLRGLTNGSTYRVRVRATYAGGNSAWVHRSGTPTGTAPPPTTTQARPVLTALTVSAGGNPVTISCAQPGNRVGCRATVPYVTTSVTVTPTWSGTANTSTVSSRELVHSGSVLTAPQNVASGGSVDVALASGLPHNLAGTEHRTLVRLDLNRNDGKSNHYGLIVYKGGPIGVSLSATPATVREGGDHQKGTRTRLTVNLTHPSPEDYIFPISIARGTAEDGDWYVSHNHGVIVRRGQTSGYELLRPVQDADTDDETLTVTLDTANLPTPSSGSDHTLTAGSPTSVTVTIEDDDDPTNTWSHEVLPSVSLSVSPTTVTEGGTVTLTATLSEALDEAVTVPWNLAIGTGEFEDILGYDVLQREGAFVFARGETTKTRTIRTQVDADSDDERFSVAMYSHWLPLGLRLGSPNGATITITDQGVVRPTGLAATEGDGRLDLSWTAPSSGTVTGYDVHYSSERAVRQGFWDFPVTDAVAGWTDANHTGTTATHALTGLVNGQEYKLRVRAKTAAGVSAWFGAVATPEAPIPVPAAPTGLTATPGDARLGLSWTAPSGSVTGYDVHYTSSTGAGNDDAASGNDPTAGWVDADHSGTTVSDALTSLTNGTPYRVRVRAVNAGGAGPWARVTGTPAAPVVWSATLTVKSLSVSSIVLGRGCDSREGFDDATATCASTSTLTEDEFSIGNDSYTIVQLSDKAETFFVKFSPASVSDSLKALNFCVGGRTLSLSGIDSSGVATFTSTDVGWSVGDTVSVSIASTCPTTGGSGGGGQSAQPAEAIDRYAALIAQMYEWRNDPQWRHRKSHTDRWDRALLAFGEAVADSTLTAMTAAEAQAWADSGLSRWVEVAKALWEIEGAAQAPVVTIAAGDAVTEGTAAVFTVAAAPAPASDLDVTVTVGQEGAFLHSSTLGAHTVTIPAGFESVSFTVVTVDDAAAEPDGSVEATLGAGTGYTVGDAASASVAVADDDGTQPQVVGAGGPYAALIAQMYEWRNDPQWRHRRSHTDRWDRALLAFGEPVSDASLTAMSAAEAQALADSGLSRWVEVAKALWEIAGGRPPPVPAIDTKRGIAREGADDAVVFTVRLDRAAPETVSVDYATADGAGSWASTAPARAGADYTATSGTLTFAAGETSKTVSVPILDDAIDEGTEYFLLRFSNPQGATLAAGERETQGLIRNSDPLQAMWLARFGRMVASDAVASVTARLETPRDAGSHVTFAGQRMNFGEAEGGGGAALATVLTGLAQTFGAPSAPAVDKDDPFARHGLTAGWNDPAAVAGARRVTGRELLLGTSFRAVLGQGSGSQWTSWGQGASVSQFSGVGAGLGLSGEAATGSMGMDYESGRLLMGFAMTHSVGRGTAQDAGWRYALGSTATMALPYARLALSDRVSVWGMAGTGSGTLSLDLDGSVPQSYRTDLAMTLAATGVRGDLVTPAEPGGFALALKADAFWVRTESDRVTASEFGSLMGARGESSRVRAVLDGSRTFSFASGAALTPKLELGVRHDAGDAETGTGLEVGAGLGYADPSRGLDMALKVHGLAVHAEDGYDEWGVSGQLRLVPGGAGRGLSMSLTPSWGVDPSGSERLWALPASSGLAANGEADPSSRFDAEVGYGMALLGDRFTGTPNLGFGLSGDGARDLRLGWRLTSAVAGDPGFEVSLDATRREAANDNAAEHGVMLRSLIRW